jgi:hypothetical protein
MSGIVCLANLFEIILSDPVKYHVFQSAINASFLPSVSARLHELSTSTIFKDLLHEAKLTTKHTNPIPTQEEPSTWMWYKFDPDEPDPAPPPSSCRYDDPNLYEDTLDDTEAQQEGGQSRVCAAKGVYMVHVGSCSIRAAYPSMCVLTVNEQVDQLHCHFYHFTPDSFDSEAPPRALPSHARSLGMLSLLSHIPSLYSSFLSPIHSPLTSNPIL